ncbi:unnamed protein product [Discosporangium mesarthrocarpum]
MGPCRLWFLAISVGIKSRVVAMAFVGAWMPPSVPTTTSVLVGNQRRTCVDTFSEARGRLRAATGEISQGSEGKILSRRLSRVVIVPDHRAEIDNLDLWHHHLKKRLVETASTGSLPDLEIIIEGMPDPYSFNTKRYESFWISHMAEDLGLDQETLVVAHGSSADACLRYLEKHQVWGAILVCPGGEIYHAGERHGRAYVWPLIQERAPWLALVYGDGDPFVEEAEVR